ncbi:hypothetical protein SEA_BRYLER_74 [Mycobacterium phage Bryler]|uniref:Uncharacterized protein n=1 Tax=Mycobacterium phage Bryler TaxID=2653755 RepID=A0A5Q2WS04_9CAUD|nr:hypothetical protein I5G79_gp24 [Mycobacterium phage Bryler]QGH80449.1 hypothetical protein SEA_BRYLER_74 [Mycobacterium phage Bryler]
MRPSPAAALANGTDPCPKACPRAQMAQIGTDRNVESVPAFSQVNTPKRGLGTDGTDIYRLTSRVEIQGVLPGRCQRIALCGAHMQKSVPSVPDPFLANLPTVIGGPRFDEALTGRN